MGVTCWPVPTHWTRRRHCCTKAESRTPAATWARSAKGMTPSSAPSPQGTSGSRSSSSPSSSSRPPAISSVAAIPRRLPWCTDGGDKDIRCSSGSAFHAWTICWRRSLASSIDPTPSSDRPMLSPNSISDLVAPWRDGSSQAADMSTAARLASFVSLRGSADEEAIRPVLRRKRQKLSSVATSRSTSGTPEGPCEGQRTSMRCSALPTGQSCGAVASWKSRSSRTVCSRSRSSGCLPLSAHATACRMRSSCSSTGPSCAIRPAPRGAGAAAY